MHSTIRKSSSIFILSIFVYMHSACTFNYIKASDYRLEDYVEELEVGSNKVFKKKFTYPFEIDLIYEVQKRNGRDIAVRFEKYDSGHHPLFINYIYTTLKVEDDLFSDEEILPVVFGAKGKIIGIGWRFVDSIKQVRFLDRIKR
jgi:hypothetical protein